MKEKWTWHDNAPFNYNLALWDGEKPNPIVFRFRSRIAADRFIARNNITITYRLGSDNDN